MGEPLKVEATLSDWEENMVDELALKYGLSGDVVLDIGCTFLVNELSGAMNGKVCILNSMRKSGFNVL